jgi:hypothetical protein
MRALDRSAGRGKTVGGTWAGPRLEDPDHDRSSENAAQERHPDDR